MVAAVPAVYPEMMHRIPLSERALKSWERLHVAGEGQPTTWEAICCLADDMRSRGEEECADVIELAANCYLRTSDWTSIRKEDIVGEATPDRPFGIAIQLGIAERGEQTKTGPRQGVRPERPVLCLRWAAYRQRTKPGQKVVKVTAAKVSAEWATSAVRLRFDPGPLHTIRHTGPSTDMAQGPNDCFDEREAGEVTPYRGQREVRTRGRWKAKTSVLRYGKTHALMAAAARVPPDVQRRGKELVNPWI